ncbi:helix-turn-helix transcriptional regulator [Staphylococcus saprophyticus]|nr:helix-turn-helix transcriptional regulator [Staphylococcus saprophyticus]
MRLVTKTKEIEHRMTDLDLSQKELAKMMGHTPNTINNFIRGRNDSFKSAYRIAYYLGGTFEDYFDIDYSDEKQEVR